MIYREFKGEKLSMLGMGTMRFPVIDGIDKNIDIKAASEMVSFAYENGINYFDTAWGYHEGNSETVLFQALNKYPRETYYIADKFPGYDLSNMTKVKEIFPAQLGKGDIGHFDFYMLHNMCEMNINQYLDERNGIMDYLLEQKKAGKIKHLGMSSHADIPCLKKFLEIYGREMEFCQIQLNFLDYSFQKAKEKIELLKEYEIPVFAMEPLRGGRLAEFDDTIDNSRLKEMRPGETAAGWAMKFFQCFGEEVKVVLTGAKDLNRLKDNIKMYEQYDYLSEEEFEELLKIGIELSKVKIVPCTSCRYCVRHCSKGLDIPKLIDLYNEHKFRGGGFIAPFYVSSLEDEKKPNSCISCGECEKICPQKIEISKVLKEFSSMLNI